MLDKCRAGEFLSLKDAGLCNIDTQCASTLTARYYKGIGSNHDNMVIEVITYEIPQKVRVRKHPVDCVDLCKCLRQHKETQKFTNRQIAEELSIPLTKVEHWFRQDGSFAIPDEDVWVNLKKLLNIATDRFDKSIMTFEGKDGVYEKGNRIYDEIGLSPTITCSEPIEVLVAEENMDIKQIGNLWGDETDFKNKTSGRVYDKNFISPALNTMQGGWKQPMIVAMRGRNPENPTSRVAGLPTEQRLEPNLKGVSNTLTSVQKDNLVLEGISTKGKVIDTASTILAGYERTNMTGFNADNGVLEFVNIKQATKDGYIRCKVGGGIADLSYPNSKTRRGRVQMEGDLSPTLTATNTDICRIEPQYRIRKLTPKECWRLMGFTDEDFEKAAEVNSNTQLYKQAGNSIVKDVLMAIFKQMLPYEERQIDGISKQVMIDVAVEEDREIMPF